MDEKIYLRLLYGMEEIPDGLARIIGRNPCYDLAGLPSPKLKEEIEGFIRYRSTQVSIGRMQGDKQFYNKVRRFLKECATANPACGIKLRKPGSNSSGHGCSRNTSHCIIGAEDPPAKRTYPRQEKLDILSECSSSQQ